MEHLSRRDAVYQQLGQLREAVQGQQQPSASETAGRSSSSSGSGPAPSLALGISQANDNITRYIDRVSTSLQNTLLSTTGSTPAASANGRLAGPASTSASASASSAAGPSNLAHSVYSARGLVSASQSYESLGASGGDVLPGYTPPQASQPTKYLHSLRSNSGKLELLLESVGSKQHPVYVQHVCPQVAGKLRVRLQGDENVNEIRLRVKGVVTTSVMRSHQTVHRTIAEEVEFWYESALLWSGASSKSSLDTSQEMHEFPFALTIPSKVPSHPKFRQTYSMPPSFVLQAGIALDIGAIDVASVRYYVKVTLARKGLLRQNERFFAPIVYLTRQKDLSFLSEGRRRALLQSQPLPPPQEAPDSWQGRADERNVRKGLFGTKKINYKIAVLLPTPHIYGKSETLPYYIRVSSSDESLLNKLGTSSLAVLLVQRCNAISQGSPGTNEVIVAKGETEVATDGINSSNNGSSTTEAVRRFKGTLTLKSAPSVNFHLTTLEISYFVVCQLMSGSRVEEVMTSIPITLVSIPPVARTSNNIEINSASASVYRDHPQADPTPMLSALEGDMPAQEEVPELPPSYFDIVETNSRAEGRADRKR